MPSTNFDALSTFIARRRPTFIWVSSKGESLPGRAIAARQRTASAPYFSRISVGTTTLPLDFDIFLRSGSVTKPDTVARAQGSDWPNRTVRVIVPWPPGGSTDILTRMIGKIVGERIGQLIFHFTGPVDGDYSDGRDGMSGKYQHTDDLDELIATWKPSDMLPRAYKDSRRPVPVIAGLPEGTK